MTPVKKPYLVCLDFKVGTAVRYLRQFDQSGAGLGWQLVCTLRTAFDPALPLEAAVVEHLRETGAVT